jgi:transposase InsO family protein
MDERLQFAAEARLTEGSFSELCRRFGISRPTGYLWLDRFSREGAAGLEDRSHGPRSCPHATPQAQVDRILELRKEHEFGARKLAKMIRDEFGSGPATSTVHEILKRHDLVPPQKSGRRRGTPPRPPAHMDFPNDVWTADFKGEFKTRDGRYVFPLTIQDAFSRFLLDCTALPRIDAAATTSRFEALFEKHGRPHRIRTDNGSPFATRAPGRLSRLSVAWIKLGIFPEFIQPGKPQQNGRHERMHRTLGEATAYPPADCLKSQQTRFNQFRKTFNFIRPHEALDLRTPATLYRPLPTPSRPSLLDYPLHFERRRVSGAGFIRWHQRQVHVSSVLVRETVGFEPIANDVWSVYFGPIHLGWFSERDYRIMTVREIRKRQ